MAQINVRVDDNLKKEAQEVFDDLGIDFTTGIRIYLTKVVKEQGIPFDMKKKNRLEQALEEYERGEYKTFDNVDDLLEDLHGED